MTREKPYLYVDAAGALQRLRAGRAADTVGPDWGSGPTPGSSIPLDDFFVAKPADDAQAINNALARGRDLLFTPGVYHLDRTIEVKRTDTVVLGLGFPTLSDDGAVDDGGRRRSGREAVRPALRRRARELAGAAAGRHATRAQERPRRPDRAAGTSSSGSAARPPARPTTSLVVNSDNVLLDDIWAWRADHGNGVGWTANTADTGVVVNGDDVTAYGLFVEHYQKYEVIWNGQNGRVVFFQNEMPYDPPSQAAWMEAPGVDGWAAFKVADDVSSFNGYGMGSYSFFNQGVDIFAAHAFEVPTTLPPGSLHDLLTVFLDPSDGKGGILNVVNDTGGPSTIANPDVPVTVVSYP